MSLVSLLQCQTGRTLLLLRAARSVAIRAGAPVSTQRGLTVRWALSMKDAHTLPPATAMDTHRSNTHQSNMTASMDTQSDNQQQSWTEKRSVLIVTFEQKLKDSWEKCESCTETDELNSKLCRVIVHVNYFKIL